LRLHLPESKHSANPHHLFPKKEISTPRSFPERGMILIEIAADIIDLKACAGQDGWLERRRVQISGCAGVDSREWASHNATMQQASSLATQRLPVIASRL
jgi:hypothetical protein